MDHSTLKVKSSLNGPIGDHIERVNRNKMLPLGNAEEGKDILQDKRVSFNCLMTSLGVVVEFDDVIFGR